MKKQLQKLSSILLCFVMLLGLLPTTALAADGITQVKLALDVPVIGQTLDFEPTAEAGNYEITSVRWLKDWGEHGNMLCDEYHKVEPGEPYTVRIWINPGGRLFLCRPGRCDRYRQRKHRRRYLHA